MAAFPFGWNPPSLGQFIEVCTEQFGANLVTMDYEVEGSFGRVRPKLLEREVDGELRHVVLPNDPEDVLITLHLVRNMADRLGIPTSAFGFEIDRVSGFIHEANGQNGDS